MEKRGPQPVRKGDTFVASADGEVFFPFDDRGTHIQGSKGTIIERVDGVIKPKNGQLLVSTGSDRLTVDTGLATVLISPDSIALISCGTGKPTRISVLDTGSLGVVAQIDKNSFILMSAAEELSVASTRQNQLELAGTDGIFRLYEGGALQRGDLYVYKGALSLSDALSHNPLLKVTGAKVQDRIGKNVKTTEKLVMRVKPQAVSPAKDVDSIVANTEDWRNIWNQSPANVLKNFRKPEFLNSDATPGTYIDQVNGTWKLVAEIIESARPDFHVAKGANITEVGRGAYYLTGGNVLVHPDNNDVVVLTENGAVLVEKGSAAVIRAEFSNTRVLNISDTRAHGVHFYVLNRDVKLTTGGEVTFSKDGMVDVNMILKRDSLGRRSMQIVELEKGKYVVINQFSIADALLRDPVLRELLDSDEEKDIKLANEIMKTAAAVAAVIDKERGPYSAFGDLEYWGN